MHPLFTAMRTFAAGLLLASCAAKTKVEPAPVIAPTIPRAPVVKEVDLTDVDQSVLRIDQANRRMAELFVEADLTGADSDLGRVREINRMLAELLYGATNPEANTP